MMPKLPLSNIKTTTAFHERHNLENDCPETRPAALLLSKRRFVQIHAIGNFWAGEKKVDFARQVIDFVIGAHSYQKELTFIMMGDQNGLQVYLALASEEAAQSLLQSAFPGIRLSTPSPEKLLQALEPKLSCMGMLPGIPSERKHSQDDGKRQEQEVLFHLERVVRGMAGRGVSSPEWAYVVQSQTKPGADLRHERETLLQQLSDFSGMIRGQVQESQAVNEGNTDHQSTVVSAMFGGEVYNKDAEYAVKMLERQQARLDAQIAMGRWQVGVYFGASRMEDYRRMEALLLSTFAGPDSRPEPIRARACSSDGQPYYMFHTYLSSEELALLCRLPKEEAPGYQVLDVADFDSAYTPPEDSALELGNIQHNGTSTGQKYSVPLADLPSHGAVFGVTGSGKTTTMLGLLYRLRHLKQPKPFLVIEPAKTEYRALIGRIENGRPLGLVPDLQVYTLGSDTIAPFRLNPFEFDLGKTPGFAPLLSHIDFLKAVFNAAFILYAPMPYILETALYEVYEERGWNLATESNVRLTEGDWKNRDQYPIFPTLTDLYNKVGQVTARLGYDEKLEQDVIAGLQARIGSMRLGPKGLMLDTPRGMPLEKLLQKPVVLELESIGNDDEKTFLIGLLLSRMYGYRRLQAAEGEIDGSLQHVLVIEEAHRLLKNVSTQVDVESANPRAQAIETFMNMLSEVRHYGQAVLIAEQIPSKLTPDVIKNTNLKIVHRILAEDDRKLLGGSMNMSETQIRRLATLQPGEAVARSSCCTCIAKAISSYTVAATS